jgi:hypothetical protein
MHLLGKQLKSTITKSKNLELHLYLIEYKTPDEIPFTLIARAYGVKPNRVRALMRSVKDEKTYLGLLEIGVSPEDIPDWYQKPTFIKKRKSVKATIIHKEKIHHSQNDAKARFQFEGLNLPPTFPTYRHREPETLEYENYSEERYMSPAEAQMWLVFLRRLEEIKLNDKKYWEERQRLRERANRSPTPEETKAWLEAQLLFKTINFNINLQEFLFWNQVLNSIRAQEKKSFFDAIDNFMETLDNVQNTMREIRKPNRIPVKLVQINPPNYDYISQRVSEINKALDDDKPSFHRELVRLGQDLQEKRRQDKEARHLCSNAINRYVLKRTFDYLSQP